MKTKNQLTCPNCKSQLDIDNLLIEQFSASIKKDLQLELKNREQELKLHKEEFNRMSRELEKEKVDIDQQITERVKEQVKAREESIKENIRKEIQAEKSIQLEELESELQRKSAQLVELNQTKAKLHRLSREFEEREAKIHLQKEQELSKRIEEAKLSIKEQAQMESFLVIKEKESIIESLKSKIEEARQKASQGSMQAQGEAQELVLEEILRDTHSYDTIEEIKKGVNGADCVQVVRTNFGAEIGKIIYESKNTKHWSDEFIKKLKNDNLTTKADIMVIVTKTMPTGSKGKYALIDGVWVTTLVGAQDLSLLLRYGILKTHAVMQTQEGKKEKMSVLYDYLTSEEFKATFESILEGFKSLQDSHSDEQRKLQLIWKKREKYLQQVLSSTIDFYGSIKGISGNAIADIKMLEFNTAS